MPRICPHTLPGVCVAGEYDDPMSDDIKRYMKYRTGVNAKNLKMFAARVPAEIHDFFEIYAYDENGLRRSKGKILELLVAKLSSYRDPSLD